MLGFAFGVVWFWIFFWVHENLKWGGILSGLDFFILGCLVNFYGITIKSFDIYYLYELGTKKIQLFLISLETS